MNHLGLVVGFHSPGAIKNLVPDRGNLQKVLRPVQRLGESQTLTHFPESTTKKVQLVSCRPDCRKRCNSLRIVAFLRFWALLAQLPQIARMRLKLTGWDWGWCNIWCNHSQAALAGGLGWHV